MWQTALLIGVGVAVVLAALRYPQIPYGLFLTAGFFKGDPRLQLGAGIDLTILFLVLAIGTAAARVIVVDRLRIPKIAPGVLIGYALLAFSISISLLYTERRDYGIDKMLRFYVFVTPALFLPIFILRNKKDFSVLFGTFVAVALAGAIEVVLSGNLGGGRVVAVLGSSYWWLGRITAMAVLLSICYFMPYRFTSTRDWLQAAGWLFIAAFTTLALVASAAKGPLLALVIALFVVGILSFTIQYPLPILRIRLRTTAAMIVVFVIAACALVLINPEGIATRYIGRIGSAVGATDVSTQVRILLYAEAAQAFLTYPLTGLGVGGFAAYGMSGQSSDAQLHPHNIVLEVASELGVFGLIGLALLFIYPLSQLLAAYWHSTSREIWRLLSTSVGLFVLLLVNAMVSEDLTENRILFAAIGIEVAAASYYFAEKRRRRQQQVVPGMIPDTMVNSLVPH